MPLTGPHLSSVLKSLLIPGMILIISACTYQRSYEPAPIGPLQSVYLIPGFEPIYNARVLITRFQAPEYAGDAGKEAAAFLFSELQSRYPEVEMVLETSLDDAYPEHLLAYARTNRFDLVITGRILYLLDGGISTDSRVEEMIRVFTVRRENLKAVAYAKAVETAAPLPELDLFVIHGSGSEAPSAMSLLKRNSIKFSRLLGRLLSSEK